ncbi:hypothetical protein Vadar_033613 [Vaccinium darrowii]|uniref:Uncharacterized protein n=1 Tax=Vaccinium darrowii TaxID=229202 RepID=A0ACB7ZNA7_9ERIC|nr:hypothetical protein Vadar_033613 [Vaccinium darrowii]
MGLTELACTTLKSQLMWQAQNFLITALHVKGPASSYNALGITEVQEQLFVGGSNSPRTVHEVIAHLVARLARWDDRRNHEDMNLFSIILNQEIRRLSRQEGTHRFTKLCLRKLLTAFGIQLSAASELEEAWERSIDSGSRTDIVSSLKCIYAVLWLELPYQRVALIIYAVLWLELSISKSSTNIFPFNEKIKT